MKVVLKLYRFNSSVKKYFDKNHALIIKILMSSSESRSKTPINCTQGTNRNYMEIYAK